MKTDTSVTPAKKRTTVVTSISIPRDLHRKALKKIAPERRSFSTYLTLLIEGDLAGRARA